MKYRASSFSRIRHHYIPVTESGCWLWLGGVDSRGYGIMSGNHKAHRVSYEANRGPIPDGMSVCHRCDVPSCINPAHLFLGTTADNMADKTRKGRCAVGEKHGKAKTTSEMVTEIRRLHAAGSSQLAIARQLGINRNTVGAAVRRETWRHLS